MTPEIGSEAEKLERARHQFRALIASAALNGRRRVEVEAETLLWFLDAALSPPDKGDEHEQATRAR